MDSTASGTGGAGESQGAGPMILPTFLLAERDGARRLGKLDIAMRRLG